MIGSNSVKNLSQFGIKYEPKTHWFFWKLFLIKTRLFWLFKKIKLINQIDPSNPWPESYHRLTPESFFKTYFNNHFYSYVDSGQLVLILSTHNLNLTLINPESYFKNIDSNQFRFTFLDLWLRSCPKLTIKSSFKIIK